MNQDVFIKLKEFVISKSSVDDEHIDKATRIQEDLGVSGDDAVAFMLAYSKEFNVDVTNFMAADYFEAEGGLRIWYLLKDLLGFNKKSTVLTVGHLEKGIYAGKLDEGIINTSSDI